MVVCTLKWLVVMYDRVGHLGCGCGGRVLGMDHLLGGLMTLENCETSRVKSYDEMLITIISE